MKRRLIAILAALGLLAGCAASPAAEPTAEAAPITDSLQIYCFQAGKADAFLFWNEAGAVLLDTGESGFGKTILAKLEELGIQKLDRLIITHFDKDHVGGAKKLLGSIPVDQILQSDCPKEGASAYDKYVEALAEAGLEAVTLREQLTFRLGDAEFSVNPPALARYGESDSNNSSLIVSVTHGGDRLLFTGDAEELRLTEFLKTEPAVCAFVKLPHHGRYQPSLKTLLAQLKPAYALITSSEEEPEDAETLALLAEYGTECFLTRSAPVLITSGPEGLTVEYAT